MRVFVLLFNAGTDNEGIHTLQINDRQKVLMFENEDDAKRFALMLEAQDLPEATVEDFDDEEIKAFCTSADYDCDLVKEGMLAVPPEKNVEELDWRADNNANTTSEVDDIEAMRRRLEGLL